MGRVVVQCIFLLRDGTVWSNFAIAKPARCNLQLLHSYLIATNGLTFVARRAGR